MSEMTTYFDKLTEAGVAEYARVAEHWFNVYFDDIDSFTARVRAGLEHLSIKHADQKINLMAKVGLFSAELFQAMISGPEDFNPGSVVKAWERMLSVGLVHRMMVDMGSNLHVDHHLNRKMLLRHLQNDMLSPAKNASEKWRNSAKGSLIP